jgi:hypothetical protein
MKSAKFVTLLVVALVSPSTFAQGAIAQSKSRQEIRQELVQARHDGIIPAYRNNFPPNSARVKRNQEVHRLTVHRGEQAPTIDAHDDLTTAR